MSGLFYRDKVETIVINLDLEPEERWKDVTVKLKPQVIEKCIITEQTRKYPLCPFTLSNTRRFYESKCE